MRNRNIGTIAPILALFGCLFAGCGPKNPPSEKATLEAGYAALESQQYNQAISNADAYLSKTPHGAGSAEALYLRGRALEGMAMSTTDAAASRANLQSARASYIQALGLNPPQPTLAYIQSSLANVAYFQDDYQTALSQWAAAYDKLDRNDLRAWALYRIGVSQQRLGQFDAADRTFTQVQQVYPRTPQAQRAREHQGARSFYLQLATFASASTADSAAATLRSQGANPLRLRDAQGHQLIRLGPFTTYLQAAASKSRYARSYPDAIILP